MKRYKVVILTFVMQIIFLYSFSDNNKSIIPQEKINMYMSSNAFGFIENKGQYIDDKGNPADFVLFKTSLKNTDVYITTKGITYVFLKYDKQDSVRKFLQDGFLDSGYAGKKSSEPQKIEWCRLDMEITGAVISKENVIVEDELRQGYFNYYLAHCPDGILNVRTYKKITVKNVYPDIDWVVYVSDTKGLKYDFVLHPGANPDNIKISYKGADNLKLETCLPAGHAGSKLLIETPFGKVIEGELLCYEKETGKQINSGYEVKENEIEFKLGSYNKSQTLVIDPPMELVWGTYYGGSNSEVSYAVSTDNQGNFLITGDAASLDFPTLDPGGGAFYQGTCVGTQDIFILKFDNNGVRQWGTYYGGSIADMGNGIAADASGNIFVSGYSFSTNFPVFDAGTYYQGSLSGVTSDDAVILKFDPNGVRQWATFYGGTTYDVTTDIVIDNSDNVFILGITQSTDLPTLDPGGSTYFQAAMAGGAGDYDAFLLKFDNSGNRLWATYLGGNFGDFGYGLAKDNSDNIFVSGRVGSTNFPVLNPGGGAYFQPANAGINDIFLSKFDNNGVMLWSTYYGGSSQDWPSCITTDQNNNIFLVFQTISTDAPTQNPGGSAYFQGTYVNVGGPDDIFIVKFDNSGVRKWATYYGGTNSDYLSQTQENAVRKCTTDQFGNLYLAFYSYSTDIPLNDPHACSYYCDTLKGASDALISCFRNDGSLSWATHYGGSGFDVGTAVTSDVNGCIFVMSMISMFTLDLPLKDPGGGAYFQGPNGATEMGIAKFCPCCSLEVYIQPQNNFVCPGGSVAFFVQAESSDTIYYQWLFNGDTIPGATDSFYTVNPVSPADTGNYSCVVYNSCDTLTSDNAILAISIPTANAGNDAGICIGNSATLTASGGESYLWNTTETTQSITVTPVIDATYTVTVTDTAGCTDTDDVTITINPLPTADAGADQSICSGETATLTAIGGTTYQWNTASTGTMINVSPVAAATYTVTITDNGCTDSDEVVVNVNSLPSILINGSTSVCEGGDTALKAEGGTGYLWNTGATIDSIVVSPAITTTYTVTGIDNNNCTNTDEIVVTVKYLPAVYLGPDTCLESGKTKILDAGAGYTGYLWQDNSAAQTYTVTGQDDYWVIVTNDCGSEGDTIVITSCPTSTIYLPNSFTPNGDNKNDRFIPLYVNITEFEMYIYDRWGQAIFHTTDINEGWRGEYNNELCPQGVYTWIIYYKGIDNTDKQKKSGYVTLLH